MADIIDELNGMDEAALLAKLGFSDKIEKAKKDIAELATLTGEARTKAAERIEQMFAPHVYPDEFGWIKKDAERGAKGSVEAACGCSPSELV